MPQGTVKEFDTGSRTGSLLMEDHSQIEIDPSSLEGSGLRMLRLGQRVSFDIVEESGRKVSRSLRILTVS
ncbi:MAG: hypothetical protein WD004_04060 [Actinomycetota bacterium]